MESHASILTAGTLLHPLLAGFRRARPRTRYGATAPHGAAGPPPPPAGTSARR
ncbi:hypothetical protein GCM10010236_56930 [Streptomyces eurythermus]|nr:hypothetical protein GCM10010236_56930 [Streptomyces eurythermus]